MKNLDKELDLETTEELDDVTTVDLALELSNYEEEELKALCEKLDDEELARILEESELKTQLRIIKLLDNKKALKLFSYMSKDDIVDILGEITAGRAKELINLMKEGDKRIIKELMGYRDDCAGGIMTTEYIKLDSKLLIVDAIKKIKEIAPKTELIDTIFVVNKRKELIGTAELRDILVASEEEKLEDITNENFVYVEPETDQEEVSLIVSKYGLTAIPVLNKKKAMLGIITIDDIVDVMVEEHTEDMLKMGGVAKEETLDSTLKQSIKLRLPWLFVNLITAFLASMTVKSFESTIAQVVALSSIMSIITRNGWKCRNPDSINNYKKYSNGESRIKRCYASFDKTNITRISKWCYNWNDNRNYSFINIWQHLFRNNSTFSNDSKFNHFRSLWNINTTYIA